MRLHLFPSVKKNINVDEAINISALLASSLPLLVHVPVDCCWSGILDKIDKDYKERILAQISSVGAKCISEP